MARTNGFEDIEKEYIEMKEETKPSDDFDCKLLCLVFGMFLVACCFFFNGLLFLQLKKEYHILQAEYISIQEHYRNCLITSHQLYYN